VPASSTHHIHHCPPIHESLNNSNRPRLARQYAGYFEPLNEIENEEIVEEFDHKKILGDLHLLFPSVNFLQYSEEKLLKLGITYLAAFNMHFEMPYFMSRLGMTEEAAVLFRQYISNEYGKALVKHERKKLRRVLYSRRLGSHDVGIVDDDEDFENQVPVHYQFD
jgi:hypothetical protein